jgi:hypothetical protein
MRPRTRTQVSFGIAGKEIIASNLARTGNIDPMVPGRKVGLCAASSTQRSAQSSLRRRRVNPDGPTREYMRGADRGTALGRCGCGEYCIR